MKKFGGFCLVLIVILTLTLCACDLIASGNKNDNGTDDKNTSVITVSFNTMGGSEIESVTLNKNSNIVLPQNPFREGYTFDGWYLDENFSRVFNEKSLITDNITLYAKWLDDIIDDGQSILKSDYFDIEELNLRLKENKFLLSSIDTFDLSSKFTVSPKASWRAYTSEDCSASTEIKTKIVSLNNGWNNIYVLVENKMTYENKTYCLQIYRYPHVTYNNLDGGALEIVNVADCKDVKFPADELERIEIICDNAFSTCLLMEKIQPMPNLKLIGAYSFENCMNLKEFTISNKVTSIGEGAFQGCINLQTINWNASACSIAGTSLVPAFTECNSLTNINISKSVRAIPPNAFSGCSNLKSIEIPDDVNSIGFNSFFACSNLETVTIPFIGATKDEKENGHFGYLFGADSWSVNQQYVPQSLKRVVITGGTTIEAYAFYKCTSLTDVSFSNNITTIGYNAFEDCKSLTSIILPDSVKTIERSAFLDCSNLSNVLFEENVQLKEIGLDAFYGTAWYNSHPDGIVYIKNILYTYKGNMPDNSSLVIKDGTSRIGAGAFADCTTLVNISIPDSVTYIEDSAFYNCSNLIDITIPDSVTGIGSLAFYGCRSLTSIAIPDSVTAINYSAFEECANLYDITIPDNLSWLGAHSLDATAWFNKQKDGVVYLNRVLYTYKGEKSDVTSVTIRDGTICIAYNAFINCVNLKSIDIPDTVLYIGPDAFYGCSDLTSVTIPSSVIEIHSSAFANCSNIEKISVDKRNACYHSNGNCLIETESKKLVVGCKNSEIPEEDSVTSIGSYAFYGCSGLTSITIPDSVMSIGSSAFSGCKSLTSITIPNSITSIGSSAFSGCSSLTSITIPNSITSIGSSAFSGCSSLTSITIPNSVTSIGSYAFYKCSGLKGVYITDFAKWCEIDFGGYEANPLYYAGNLYLNNILVNDPLIPDNITSIDSYAFSGWNVASITIPDSVMSISSGAFSGRKSLTSITIPDSVMSIGSSAFSGCKSLTSITIPNSITSIGSSAFSGCSSLTSVIIPDSITSIGYSAFRGCSSLVSVKFEDTSTWYCTGSYTDWENKTGGTEIDVTVSSSNAKYFTSTYLYYYWYKK